MMWSSIANLKENLNKIALDVHDGDDDEEELEIYGRTNGEDSAVYDRRNSHSFAHSKSVSRSPVANGTDSAYISEIGQYKEEIKKLQASEAEIKALSVNYAALLKQKEDHILRLNKENGSLKQNLEATNASLSASRNEGSRISSNGTSRAKGSSDHLYSRQHRFTSQVKNHTGNQIHNGSGPKLDGVSNGLMLEVDYDVVQSKMEGMDKELAVLMEEKNGHAGAGHTTSEIRQLKMELELERDKLANALLRFQEANKVKESFQEELKLLKMERDKEMSEIRNELNEKVLEIKRLQIELNRREDEEAGNTVDSLRSQIADLKKENTTLKVEKNDLEAALEKSRESSTEKISPDASHIQNKDSLSEIVDSSRSSPGKEDMEQSIQKLNKDLSEARRERDKALQQLTRLKQHLLEKESEDSEKMDEDRKIIEELRESNEYLRAQTSHLEKALKQATANLEELKAINNNELQKSREIVDDLNKKLANCVTTIDAKNAELLNLQMALGQYYAEIEAKEHLDRELAHAREELTNLSQQLKEADERAGASRGEKEEILAKLSQTEKTLAEWKSRVSKLEEDNAKLRRAVEQSMTRLNRMSVDSDFLVDRRIVIKLLVTYFQRNHSKEVLDLMVRMLGFSDEDKQRIGVAQQGSGKGVVRGVFGLPGRLVGGILGGSSTDSSASANAGSESQSFADMWVDFLLKETEERERRESAKDAGRSAEDSHSRSPHTAAAVSPLSNQRLSFGTTSGSSTHLALNQNSSPPPLGNLYHSENFGSEFSTVPLTSSDSTRITRLLPRY